LLTPARRASKIARTAAAVKDTGAFGDLP
jgi:hypothetical protein